MEVLKNKNYVKLFFASLTSQLGTILGNMAFVFYLLDRFSEQPAYANAAELMYALPSLFVFFIVGVIADRFDRVKIAEYSDWIRMVLTIFILIAIVLDMLALVFVLIFLRSAVSKFFIPAQIALVQGILQDKQLMQAAGLNQMVSGVFVVFGMGLGAAAYLYLGIAWAIVIDGISMVISALLIRSCNISLEVRLPNGKTNWRSLDFRTVTLDFMIGIKYILRYRLLLSIVLGYFVFGLINGTLTVLPVFTLKYKLVPDNYEQYMALFAAFLGAGFFIGSIIGSKALQKFKPHIVINTGLFLISVLAIVFGFITNIWVYLLFVTVVGACIAPVNIALGGWLPQIVAADKMGRVGAWIEPIMMLAQSIALGLVLLLYPKMINLESIYFGLAGIAFILFVYYSLSLTRWEPETKSLQKEAGN
ncbi:MAG: MFS transporter [Candidatus Pristimantibacillus lignocellulolyticus]|uniref:MFS transporter n=1 Tax=Candidatus Pristimantibacillus lignocellulolyticus TaxID=2994561 RepID=A0A9J6ZDH8_9BACL|nr:MAG: MFS transporter [Candidatus Pristimantibacillus lignocellulolyticus]